MARIRRLFSSLSFRIISFIFLLLLFCSLIVSIIGLISFTNAFKREYSTTSYHMASTACTLVNGDNIDKYLNEGIDEEYLKAKGYLDTFCLKMNVSLVYVIKVDQSDYGSFLSVFNSVNNSVENTNYSPWDLGYKRNTTNDEYREKYIALYSGEVEYETVYRTTKLNGLTPHLTILVPMKTSTGEIGRAHV